MPINENDLFLEIVIDRKAKEYVETSEEEDIPEQKNDVEETEKPDVPKVEKHLPKTRKMKEIFECEEDAPLAKQTAEKEPPATKAKRKPSQQQLDHLAKIRVKALEAKKKKKAERLAEQSGKAVNKEPVVQEKEPAHAPTPPPTPPPSPKAKALAKQKPQNMSEAEVDQLRPFCSAHQSC